MFYVWTRAKPLQFLTCWLLVECVYALVSRILSRKQIIYQLKFGFSLLENFARWSQRQQYTKKKHVKNIENQPSKNGRDFRLSNDYFILTKRLTCALHIWTVKNRWTNANDLNNLFYSQLKLQRVLFTILFLCLCSFYLPFFFHWFAFDFSSDNRVDKL